MSRYPRDLFFLDSLLLNFRLLNERDVRFETNVLFSFFSKLNEQKTRNSRVSHFTKKTTISSQFARPNSSGYYPSVGVSAS